MSGEPPRAQKCLQTETRAPQSHLANHVEAGVMLLDAKAQFLYLSVDRDLFFYRHEDHTIIPCDVNPIRDPSSTT